MSIDLKEAFIADCTETHNYTEEEAEQLFKEKGESFIEEMLNDMWTNWSENFPVKTKGEEDEQRTN